METRLQTRFKLPDEIRELLKRGRERGFTDWFMDDMLRKQAEAHDKLVGEAFLEHFGFPIEEARDKENFERITTEDGVEKLKYRGQTFLICRRRFYTEHNTADGVTATAEIIVTKQ